MGSRSSVTRQLPATLRKALDARLIKSGFCDYQDLVDWLKKHDHQISRSALHRYGSALEHRLIRVRDASLHAKAIVAETSEGELAEVTEASLRLAQERVFNLLLAADEGDTEELLKAVRVIATSAAAMVSVRKAAAEAVRIEQARQCSALQDATKEGQLDPKAAARALAILGLA